SDEGSVAHGDYLSMFSSNTIPCFRARDAALLRSCLFFFSSRRRHTRWPRDWSSDVCSSDLPSLRPYLQPQRWPRKLGIDDGNNLWYYSRMNALKPPKHRPRMQKITVEVDADVLEAARPEGASEIGRASCRERGEISGGRMVV